MHRQPDMPDHRLFRRPPARIRTRGQLHLEPFDVKHEAREDTYAQRAIPDRTPLGLGLEVSGFPGLVEGRLLGAVDAEVDEPACPGVGLDPLVLVSPLAPASAAARAR
jgi:hypothetical protein